MKTRHQTNGFTLIELIIYMALLAAFLLILTSIFVSVLDIRVGSQAVSSVDQDGRFILSRLAYDINRASAVSLPNSTTMTLSIGGQSYTYSIVSSNLQLAAPTSTDNLNGSGTTISGLNIQRVANTGGREETFQIVFTLTSVNQKQSGPEVRNFQTTIGRRIR